MENNKLGNEAGIIAIIFGIAGFFIVPPLFILFSIIISIIGGLFAFTVINKIGIFLNLLGLLLAGYAFLSSPEIFELFGINMKYIFPSISAIL